MENYSMNEFSPGMAPGFVDSSNLPRNVNGCCIFFSDLQNESNFMLLAIGEDCGCRINYDALRAGKWLTWTNKFE